MHPTTRALCQRWGVDVKHALYRKPGTWYHLLKKFPAALLDKHGYIVFRTREDYEGCPGATLSKKEGKDWAVFSKGISSLPGYVCMDNDGDSPPFALAEEAVNEHTEGAAVSIRVNRYERSLDARDKCIEVRGSQCEVCRFDFERAYGQLGRGFIHVHHIRPLSEIKAEYVIDPVNDLRSVCPDLSTWLETPIPQAKRAIRGARGSSRHPVVRGQGCFPDRTHVDRAGSVCPNCHAMLHQRTPPYSIKELQKLMRSAKKTRSG